MLTGFLGDGLHMHVDNGNDSNLDSEYENSNGLKHTLSGDLDSIVHA